MRGTGDGEWPNGSMGELLVVALDVVVVLLLVEVNTIFMVDSIFIVVQG